MGRAHRDNVCTNGTDIARAIYPYAPCNCEGTMSKRPPSRQTPNGKTRARYHHGGPQNPWRNLVRVVTAVT
eukprot:5009730-Amphidinium_carterae.2